MTERKADVRIGEVKPIRNIEPGDDVLINERESIFLGEWNGFAYYTRKDEEPETRKVREGNFREGITFGWVEAI